MSDVDRVVEALRRAATVTALTGAGVSAASGVPTFRGGNGLWRNVRAETLATSAAFQRDPRLVWEWYDWRRQMIAAAQPNAAHQVLARWSQQRPGFTLITQNVDGLHERAGAERLIGLHGSIWSLRCWNACEADRGGWLDDRAPLPSLPPRCPSCGGLARPGVVWFGEGLNPDHVDHATRAAGCDVFLTIGTSAVVYPAAGLIPRARAQGALTIEINPDATGATGGVDIVLRGPAEAVLADIDGKLREA